MSLDFSGKRREERIILGQEDYVLLFLFQDEAEGRRTDAIRLLLRLSVLFLFSALDILLIITSWGEPRSGEVIHASRGSLLACLS
jgi:hypothetical protein